MDLQLFSRVLWRFKVVVVLGLLAAAALAFFATFKVGPHGLQSRKTKLYSVKSQLLITQAGFPYGRATATGPVPGDEAKKLGIDFADQNRFTSLAYLYSNLMVSDPVREIILRSGPIDGEIEAAPVVQDAVVTLPLLTVLTIDKTPESTVDLNKRTVNGFKTYLDRQQAENQVPSADRIVVQQIVGPDKVEIFKGISKTMPIVIFLAVAFLTVALAFVLENLRPRVRPVAAAASAPATRQTA